MQKIRFEVVKGISEWHMMMLFAVDVLGFSGRNGPRYNQEQLEFVENFRQMRKALGVKNTRLAYESAVKFSSYSGTSPDRSVTVERLEILIEDHHVIWAFGPLPKEDGGMYLEVRYPASGYQMGLGGHLAIMGFRLGFPTIAVRVDGEEKPMMVCEALALACNQMAEYSSISD